MAIETQKYIRKDLIVDAVRISNANFDEVASWCQGEVATAREGRQAGKRYIKVRVHNPKHPRQTQAFIGDWLLYTEKGYKIYTNKAFRLAFDLEAEVGYPRGDGDTIVLGPGCFVTKDGSVLNWNGINYIPQPQPMSDPRLTGDPVVDAKAEEETPVYPEATTIGGTPREEINVAVPQSALEDAPPPVDAAVKHQIIEAELHSVGLGEANPHVGAGRIEVEDGISVQDTSTAPPPIKENGQRVLSHQEQAQLGPERVKELIKAGEAILEQDAA